MLRHGCNMAMVIVALLFAIPAAAQPEIDIVGPFLWPGEGTVVCSGNVSYRLPFSFPSAEEVVDKMPQAAGRPELARVHCELVSFRFEDERTYPLVGPARQCKARFKCTVRAANDEETDPEDVFFVDYRQLVLTGVAEQNQEQRPAERAHPPDPAKRLDSTEGSSPTPQ